MLYNLALPVPSSVRSKIRQTGRAVLKYSQHAKIQADQKSINLPYLVDYTKCEPFEVECKKDGMILKVGYRTRYQSSTKCDLAKCDLVLIIHPADNFVRTIWLNAREDDHATLDSELYTIGG